MPNSLDFGLPPHPHDYMTSTAPTPKRWRIVTTVWALLAVGLTVWIFHCFQEDQAISGTWGCEMSYMWPTYHKVDWPDNPSAKYSLWLYREQGWDRDIQVRALGAQSLSEQTLTTSAQWSSGHLCARECRIVQAGPEHSFFSGKTVLHRKWKSSPGNG